MRALITGASKGIGRAIAIDLSRDCSAMVLVARHRPPLETLCDELAHRAPDCRVFAQCFDVTDPEAVEEGFKVVHTELKGLDLLVNCAGKAIPPTAVQEISLATWNQIFAVNVAGPFLLTKAAIPAMRGARNPAIVNIASTAGISARPGWSAYAASKAGLINFSTTMAAELKPYGIRVHCVAPGKTGTELRRVLAPDEDPAVIMQPEAVARIVRFLVTTDGHFLQGQTIVVRGD